MTSRRIFDWLLVVSATVGGASCVVALKAAWGWPLVGDAALMRYVLFRLGSGRAPYREIIDINLPGCYFFEACATHLFGKGAASLRIYDGFLCIVVCVATVALCDRGWRARACGLLAGLLFVLIHLRDGVVQASQRDLVMGVLVLIAYLALVRLRPIGRLSGVLIFEFFIGLTLTIKPALLPLAALPLLLRFDTRERLLAAGKTVGLGVLVLLLPTAVMFFWLHHFGALAAFFHVLRMVDAAHGGLAHETLLALLVHSVAPIPVVL